MPARDNVSAIQTAPTTPLPPFPKLPEKLLKIVPELSRWESEMEVWLQKANAVIFKTAGE